MIENIHKILIELTKQDKERYSKKNKRDNVVQFMINSLQNK